MYADGGGEPVDSQRRYARLRLKNGLRCASRLPAHRLTTAWVIATIIGTRSQESHPGCPLVLCTANVQKGLAKRASDLGVPVVPKPINADKIKNVATELGVFK